MSVRNMGVLGGSFNPIHNGHIALANQAIAQCSLERVLFIPTGTPPHKPEGLADAQHRWEMVNLAVEGHPGLEVSDIELSRTGLSYTVDTLGALKAQSPEAAIFLIIGADTLLDLPNWRRPDAVFRLASFIVWQRPGFRQEEVDACAGQLRTRGASLRILSSTGPDISATLIRNRIAQGLPIDGLVPQSVARYLQKTGLYTKATNAQS